LIDTLIFFFPLQKNIGKTSEYPLKITRVKKTLE